MVKNIAIIPARSGSKRIKDKNIYNFKGKPLIAWTIEAALESKIFDKVFVSTDSEQYAEIARKYGAWVPFLRDSAFDDFSGLAEVVKRSIEIIEQDYDIYDNLALLQVTCPLRTSQNIVDTYNEFLKQNCPTLLTCFEFNFMNPWWSFKLNNGEAEFMLSSPVKSRSQDNAQLYCPTGAIGFAKINEYKKDSTFYGQGHKFYPIDWKNAIDIDNYEDIEMAEVLFDIINKERNV